MPDCCGSGATSALRFRKPAPLSKDPCQGLKKVRLTFCAVLILSSLSWINANEASSQQDVCESVNFVLNDDYPGGNMGDCRVVGDSIFELTLKPEDEPPINPSPWYGFQITRREGVEAARIRISLRYPEGFTHRYRAKVSSDGSLWRLLPDDATRTDNEGTTDLVIAIEQATTFVSAQENLNLAWYDEMQRTLEHDWPALQHDVIGHSLAKREVVAYQTNPGAPKFVLLLGRAHPPEVPGALGFDVFVRALAEMRRESCVYGTLRDCRFFNRHNFVLVPLLNPDGVVLGHWRHNLGSTDLNRDWGFFEQPETSAVERFVQQLEAKGAQLTVALDFHATNRSILFTQTEDDVTDPPAFAERWFSKVAKATQEIEEPGYASGIEHGPRELSDLGTSKNYFFRRNGVPSITFELADTVDRDELKQNVGRFADAFVMLLSEEDDMNRQTRMHAPTTDNACAIAFERLEACQDYFCFLLATNLTSMIVLNDIDVLSNTDAANHAATMLIAEQNASNNPELRVTDYLKLEGQLIELSGPEISNIHASRSRQDVHGTVRRMITRQQWLVALEELTSLHRQMIDLAERRRGTVIPAYTHGVPAQPTTYAHQLMAYAHSIGRIIERLREGFNRLNQAPLGASVGNTGSYRFDRDQMARLLGFNKAVSNSYDANFVSTLDYRQELADILASSTSVVTQFVANVHAQQRNPWPWIYVARDQVLPSSSMPQKRNPRSLDRLRTDANQVLALAHRTRLRSHNVDAGMHDYRLLDSVTELVTETIKMYRGFTELLNSIVIDDDRALAEIDRSFAASAQIADVVFRETDVPFRTAQELAAAIVEFARESDQQLNELTQRELNQISRTVLDRNLPVPRGAILRALDPIYMVASRKGSGGPQLSSIDAQIAAARTQLEETRFWLLQSKSTIIEAESALQSSIFDICSHVEDELTDSDNAR